MNAEKGSGHSPVGGNQTKEALPRTDSPKSTSGKQLLEGASSGVFLSPTWEGTPETQNWFRDFLVSLPEMVYELDSRGMVVFLTHFERTGYRYEDFFQGIPGNRLIASEDRSRVQRNIRRGLDGNVLQTHRYRFRCQDGSTFPVLIHSTPVMRNGRPTGVRGVIFDVTVEENLRRQLEDRQKAIRALLDAQTDPLILQTLEGKILELNQAAADALGGTMAELLGQNVFSKFPQEVADRRREEVQAAGREGSPRCFADSRGGRIFETSVVPLPVQPDGPSLVAVCARDITLSSELLQDLERRNSQLEVLTAIATLPESNQPSIAHLGFQVAQLLGKACASGGSCVVRIAPPETLAMEPPEEGGGSQWVRAPLPSGSTPGGELLVQPCSEGREGVVPGCICHDRAFLGRVAERVGWLLERERMARIQEKHTDDLIHASRLAAIGEMASAVAHELNQPLYAIKAFAQTSQLLLEKVPDLPEPLRANLQKISDQIDRATSIVGEIKSLSRKSPLSLEEVDLQALLQRLLDFLHRSLESEGILIQTKFPKERLIVMGDAIRLEQVFLNLLQNGRDTLVEATRRQLSISLKASDEGQATVAVTDCGRGFDATVAERLFQPFFTTKGVGRGTGLGLSICRKIVQDHGGIIYARSRPGNGATFTVDLPLHNRAAAHPAPKGKHGTTSNCRHR